MIKYAVVEVVSLAGLGVTPRIVSGEIKDIKQAEKARIGYLDLFPKVNPQNVQVIQYSS